MECLHKPICFLIDINSPYVLIKKDGKYVFIKDKVRFLC